MAHHIKKMSVPFDKEGNMCWSSRSAPYSTIDQEADKPFRGRVKFKNILEYSSNVAVFVDVMDQSYYMSQGEFERIIPYMSYGVLEGNFYYHKQGTFYRLRYLEDAVV